jgi:hypothetical protein
MGHMKIVVDNDKIVYSGPFDANGLFRMISQHLFERGFDMRQDKDFEINSPKGKGIEWQISPWKRISDYIRYFFRIRIVISDMAKTDVTIGRKKKKVERGKVIIAINAFIEFDYDSYWEERPLLHFIRTIYDYFVFRPHSEKFEQVLVHDANILHTEIEKFLNMYKSYKTISRQAP